MNKTKIIVYGMFLAFILFPVDATPFYALLFENMISYLRMLPELDWIMALFMATNCLLMFVLITWMFPFAFYYWSKVIDEFESLKKLEGRAKQYKDIPKVAVVIPAFNEEKTIVQTVLSCQAQTWRPSQIIIIDDGSTDGMVKTLISKFGLIRKNLLTFPYTLNQKGRIIARYSGGNITLISKENAGKSFALNCGFDEVRKDTKFTCIFDGDTIANPEGIRNLVYPMIEDEDLVLTSGRNQIINGCNIADGKVTKVGTTWNPLVLFQIREYIYDLINKAFENRIDAQTILTGNFSAYRMSTVYHPNILGFDGRGLTEDYDYNFSVHTTRKVLNENGWKVRIILNAQGWTQAPHSLYGLINQRARWRGGILETLKRNKKSPLNGPMNFVISVARFRVAILPLLVFVGFTFIPLAVYAWFTNPYGYLVKDLILYFYAPAFVVKMLTDLIVYNYVDWKYVRNYDKPSTYAFLSLFRTIFGYIYSTILLYCLAIASWRLFKGTGKWGKMERTKVD